MKRAVGLLAIANLATMAAGFTREVAIAFRFGTSGDADALALTMFYVDGTMAVAVAGVAGAMMVPVVVRVVQTHGTDSAFRLLESCMIWAALLLVPLAVVAGARLGALGTLIAPEFPPARHVALGHLLAFAVPTIVLVLLSSVMAGVLQAQRDYFTPVFGRSVFALSTGAAILLFPSLGVRAAGAGLLAGALLLVLFHAWGLRRLGWRWQRPMLVHPGLGHALRMAVPTLLALVLINVLMGGIQRMSASGLSAGGLAAMNYAQRALNIVSGLTMSLATVSLTELSVKFEAEGTGLGTGKVLSDALMDGLWILVPASCLLAMATEPLVALLFLRGQYDLDALKVTASCLRWLAGSIVPGLIVAVLLRAAPAFGRPWRSVVISAAWLTVTVTATTLLLPSFGAVALAAGHTIGMTAAAFVSAALLADLVPVTLYRSVLAYGARVAGVSLLGLAAAAGLVAVVGPQQSFGPLQNVERLLLIAIPFVASAGVLSFVTRDPRTRAVAALLDRWRAPGP